MKKLFFLVIVLTLLLLSSSGYATIYWEESFDSYSSTSDLDGYTNDWDIWTQNPSGQESSWISLETSNCQSSKCLKLTYPSDASAPVGYPGATFTATESWGGEFFVRFYARVTDKQAARGKFYKMFGASGGSGDSNWTFSANTYTAGRLNEFAHGGTNSSGDTQCYARFNNGTVGCSSGDAGTVQNYYGANWNWDDENWHKFIIHFKFNTNSSSDGIFRLWIDGVEWFYVTGVQQRPNGNDRFFKHFNLGDYTSATNTGAWAYWYDEFVVASTYLEADTGSGGDSTPPELSSASINAAGTQLTFLFNEIVTQGSGYNDSDWTIDCSSIGNDIGLTYSSGDGTATHIYTISQTIYPGYVCNLDFNGNTDSEEDGSGNDLEAIVSGSVTNNSTLTTVRNNGGRSISGGIIK